LIVYQSEPPNRQTTGKIMNISIEFNATYSAEDNKLRIYASERLDAETYNKLKSFGFNWAPKQKLFVAPRWTPSREDLCLELAGDIFPEMTTMAERAEAKAERLAGIAMRKAEAATAYDKAANNYSASFSNGQPILVGHHSEKKARNISEKAQRARDNAIKAAKSVNYWNWKISGTLHHAERKNSSDVRQRRIKTLLKELRDLQRAINKANRIRDEWLTVESNEDIEKYALKLYVHDGGSTDEEKLDFQAGLISHADLKEKRISAWTASAESPTRARWIAHVLNRLSYERSFLGEIPRFAGLLTPVILQGFARTMGAEKPKACASEIGFSLSSPVSLPIHLDQGKKIDLSENQWRDLMHSCGYIVEIKKRRKSSSTKANSPIINLSECEAQKLQDLWNIRMARKCFEQMVKGKIAPVVEMSQKGYSYRAKGNYGPCEAIPLKSNGQKCERVWKSRERVMNGEPVCRIRIFTGGSEFYKPNSIVRINDKPVKSSPLDWVAIDEELKLTEDDHKRLKFFADREAA